MKRLTFDFETTNYSYGSALDKRNRIVMVSWQVDGGKCLYYYGDIMKATRFWKALKDADVLVAYNAKFEMLWLLRMGVDIHKYAWHDPMLAERVIQGNRTESVALGPTAERYGLPGKEDTIDKLMKAGVCPSEMDRKALVARCVRDVRTTDVLTGKLLRRLTNREQLHLYRVRADLCPVLAEIEHNGIYLNKTRVHQEVATYNIKSLLLKRRLDKLTGGINLRSPDQVAKFLYETLGFEELKNFKGKPLRNKPSKQFPEGRPKTDAKTIAILADRDDLTMDQREFIDTRSQYMKIVSGLSKNLEFFEEVVNNRNCHFHGQFNQTVAATHRLTSTGLRIMCADGKERSVQFQNMPGTFKKLFSAPEGYVVSEVDAKQLEFRVGVDITEDEQGWADIHNPDFDAHCTSAAEMNEVDYSLFLKQYRAGDKLRKAQRSAAKPDTFKPFYGGTKGTPKQERWYKAFQERYKGVVAGQDQWLTNVAVSGELRLTWGMRFYWNGVMDRRGVFRDARTGKPLRPQICNYPVQNLATAEIVPIAIILTHKRCRELGLDVKFVNTVHDSIIVYVRDDETKTKFEDVCKWAFTDGVVDYLLTHYGYDFKVPLGCELSYGKHWGEPEVEIDYDKVKETT